MTIEPITRPDPRKRDEMDRAVRVMEFLLMEALNAKTGEDWEDNLINESLEEIKMAWTRLKTLIRELTN